MGKGKQEMASSAKYSMNSGYYFLSHSTTKWWYFKVKTQRKERRKQARKRIMGDIMEREDGRNPEQGQQITKGK